MTYNSGICPTFTSFAYSTFAQDVGRGAINGHNLNVLLATSAYDGSDTTLATITSHELSGGGYARVSGTHTLGTSVSASQLTLHGFTPSAATFAAFSGTWQYIVYFNTVNSTPWFAIKASVPIIHTSTPLTIDFHATPYLTVTSS